MDAVDRYLATLEEEIADLERRGIAIPADDRWYAEYYLLRLGRQRIIEYFCGFFHPEFHAKLGCPEHLHGTISFRNILKLHTLDRRLRYACLDALESIEFAVKIGLFHQLNQRHKDESWWQFIEPFRHIDDIDDRKAIKFQQRIEEKVYRLPEMRDVDHRGREIEKSITEFNPLRIMDALSFTDTSLLYANLPLGPKKKIAQPYFQLHPRELENWLKALSTLRNLAAHYNRVWNVRFRYVPKIPDVIMEELTDLERQYIGHNHFYDFALVMFYMLKHVRRGQSHWHRRLYRLLHHTNLPENLAILPKMGFPENWYESPFWDGATTPDPHSPYGL